MGGGAAAAGRRRRRRHVHPRLRRPGHTGALRAGGRPRPAGGGRRRAARAAAHRPGARPGGARQAARRHRLRRRTGVPGGHRRRARGPEYPRVASTYLRGGSPGLVLRPRTPPRSPTRSRFARRHRHLPLGVRSGGHGISGRSTNGGGLVIDVGRMNSIEVLDPDRRLVRIGPGATWKQVAAALDPYGWALGSGDYGGVGVGGLATAGGIGLLSRKHGLTIDHLRAVELVLADGRHGARQPGPSTPTCSGRSAAPARNFGVVTAFEFEVDEVGDDRLGAARPGCEPDPTGLLRRCGQPRQHGRPGDTTAFLVMGCPPRPGRRSRCCAVVDAHDPGDDRRPAATRSPGRPAGTAAGGAHPVRRRDGERPPTPARRPARVEPAARSAFLVQHVTPEFARDADAAAAQRQRSTSSSSARSAAPSPTSPPDATAYATAPANFQVTAMGANQAALNAAWDRSAPPLHGLYLSFDTDLRPERLPTPGRRPRLARLRALKRALRPGQPLPGQLQHRPDPDLDAACPGRDTRSDP